MEMKDVMKEIQIVQALRKKSRNQIFGRAEEAWESAGRKVRRIFIR